VGKGIQKGDDVISAWMREGTFGNLGEELYLVSGCFSIATGGLDNFEGRVTICARKELSRFGYE
jgi:hypothetical protein